MIPVNQTKGMNAGERGNCLAACIASVFELDIDAVPQFEELPPGVWRKELGNWLTQFRKQVSFVSPETLPSGFYIVVGQTGFKCRHACVGYAGAVVHDPDKERAGLVSYEYLMVFEDQTQ